MDLWQTLQNTNRPILIYGMGNGADKIVQRLSQYGISVADYFASDGFVRGQIFHGKTVLSRSEALCRRPVGRWEVNCMRTETGRKWQA